MRNTTFFVLVLLGLLATAGSVQGVAEADEMSEDGDMTDVDYMAKADAFMMSLPDNGFFRMDMQDLMDAVDAGDENLVILDVRPKSLYDAGHIPDSMNIPDPEIIQSMDMVPTDKKIAVVCQLDTNSAFAVSVLRIFGDRDAWVVVGGVPGWQDAGGKLVATKM
ncbi:MAG TPA: rhodanese-like domain-containing protein [Methanotrichaceae archaeon]|nr:rhodanese-like domain-containing protein [Methanotrichaceae archaeon]